jgi:hypothetical protein
MTTKMSPKIKLFSVAWPKIVENNYGCWKWADFIFTQSGGRRHPTWPLTNGPVTKMNFQIFPVTPFGSWSAKTNSFGALKIPRTFLEVDWSIWNNFRYWHFVAFSTDSELKFKLLPGFEISEASHIGNLCTLLQIHKCITLDKKFTNLTYKHWSLIWLKYIDQNYQDWRSYRILKWANQ